MTQHSARLFNSDNSFKQYMIYFEWTHGVDLTNLQTGISKVGYHPKNTLPLTKKPKKSTFRKAKPLKIPSEITFHSEKVNKDMENVITEVPGA